MYSSQKSYKGIKTKFFRYILYKSYLEKDKVLRNWDCLGQSRMNFLNSDQAQCQKRSLRVVGNQHSYTI